MYKCRHCGAKISRLNKDICPLCGGKFPLEGMDDVTTDLTKTLEKVEIEQVKQRNKITAMLLTFFLGFLGVNEFYLGYKKAGFIALGLTSVIVSSVILLKLFVIDNPLIIVIPLVVYELFYIIQGLHYLSPSSKDKNGELLK